MIVPRPIGLTLTRILLGVALRQGITLLLVTLVERLLFLRVTVLEVLRAHPVRRPLELVLMPLRERIPLRGLLGIQLLAFGVLPLREIS